MTSCTVGAITGKLEQRDVVASSEVTTPRNKERWREQLSGIWGPYGRLGVSRDDCVTVGQDQISVHPVMCGSSYCGVGAA